MAALYSSASYDYRFAPPGYEERLYRDYRTSTANYVHAQTVAAAQPPPPPPEQRTWAQWCLRCFLRAVVPVGIAVPAPHNVYECDTCT